MLSKSNHLAHYRRLTFYLLLLDCSFQDSCGGRPDSQICYATIVAVDYDPVEAYVYWTDQSFGINRVNLDGANEEQLVLGKDNL